MAWRPLSSLQVRISLLVLLALLPALGLTLYSDLEERRFKRADMHADALRLARLVSADHEQLVEGARQLLVALARLPALRGGDHAACAALFADLLVQYPIYANLGASDPKGDVVCSGQPAGAVNIADRAYFQRAVESRGFAVGDFQIGRVTKRATVNFGYPVMDERGGLRAVVFSALDLAWVGGLVAQAELPPGAVVSLIDRHGTVLARYPDQARWVGRPLPEAPLLEAIRTRGGRGTAEIPGADGEPRLFSFAPLRQAGPGADAHVTVGIPAAVAFANADRVLRRNLLALGLVTVVALLAAWVGGHLFIVRRVRALVTATERISRGDLSARTGMPRGRGELGRLARAFDRMADSLEQAERRKRLEDDLRRKNYELEQQNRAVQEATRLKTEFVSVVSHELRAPLTSILGYVDLLLERERGALSDEQRDWLRVVQGNADRLLRLINELLDLSRIEAGRVDLDRASLDLAGIIRAVARSLDPLIVAKRQRLALDLADGLPPAWADADRVTQILTNLITNAHKYTPPEGRITVGARRDGGLLRVEVRDTGDGLTPEEQAQLFTRFFRSRQPGRPAIPGTGLGLVIARLLVELHGGEITVTSAPGEGSTFAFSLPLAGPAADGPPARAAGDLPAH